MTGHNLGLDGAESVGELVATDKDLLSRNIGERDGIKVHRGWLSGQENKSA